MWVLVIANRKKEKQSLIGCLLRKYNPIVQSRANIVARGTLIYWADLPGSKIKCFSVHYHNNLKCLAVRAIKSIKAACVVFSCKLNHWYASKPLIRLENHNQLIRNILTRSSSSSNTLSGFRFRNALYFLPPCLLHHQVSSPHWEPAGVSLRLPCPAFPQSTRTIFF